MKRDYPGPRRPESERQALIEELRKLRAEGAALRKAHSPEPEALARYERGWLRQHAIEATLRSQFELGWPELPRASRRESTNGVHS